MTVRLVVVDDHRLFRQGLSALVRAQPDLQIVGEAADVPGATSLLRSTSADVVVLDLGLPGVSGLSLVREVRRLPAPPRVLILSMLTDEQHVAQALEEGVAGYVCKEDSADEVCSAIRTVAAGRTYLTPRISRVVLEEYMRARGRSGDRAGPLGALTSREHEIFDLVVRGFSTASIARQLALSPRTVETHRAHIMRKLGVHSAADLVRLAAKHGLLPA